MASRTESSPQLPVPTGPNIEQPSYRDIVEQNAIDLADFLSGSRIDFVMVTSVLPSARFGIAFTVEIGRRGTNPNGEDTIWYSADSASVRMLDHTLGIMSKKKRKKNRQIIQNLKFIQEVALDPDYWNEPFNQGTPT